MTEADWLACDDPREMLDQLPATASERKCRLLTCALLRRANPIPNHPVWASVALGERWADGAVTEDEVRAFQSAEATANWGALAQPAHALLHLCANALGDGRRFVPDLLRELFGNPFRPVVLDPDLRTKTVIALAQAAYDERSLPGGQLDLQRLAVLADALEDAGCTDQAIFDHLRGPGPHVRGCWPVDLVLAKE
jgi:hypothetical protein